MIRQLIEKPRRVFLLDGLGALVSALFLGVVLIEWNRYFGMPTSVLAWLAGAASAFALYSLACYMLAGKKWKAYLKVIALFNTLYCCITLGLVIKHFQALTALGVLYFVLEMFIIIVLVMIERRVMRHGKYQKEISI